MARTALTVQQIVPAGLAPTYTPANVDGNSVPGRHTGRFVHVKNGSGASVTVTVPTPGTVDGNAIADRAVAIDAGADEFIGPFGPVYQQSDGSVHLDYSAVASVTVAVLQA